MNPTDSDLSRRVEATLATSRREVFLRGGSSISRPIFLAAILTNMVPENALAVLAQAGAKDGHRILELVAPADPCSMGEFDSVKPDSQLHVVLSGELGGFLEGRMSMQDAAAFLLDPSQRTSAVEELLQDPAQALRLPRGVSITSASELLKGLIRYYQLVHQLGRKFLTPRDDALCSDYATGQSNSSFERELRSAYKAQNEAHAHLFSSSLYGESILGECRKKHGADAAHALAIVLLCDLGQVGAGAPRIREIAWTLSPKYYHRSLKTAFQAARDLLANGYVEPLYSDKAGHVGQMLIPTAKTMMSFLTFLQVKDPIDLNELDALPGYLS